MLSFLYDPLFIDFATIILLLVLGFILRLRDTISEPKLKFFNSLCIDILLPCFIFSSFMIDIDPIFFSNGLNIFLWSVFIQGFFLLSLGIYYHKKQNLTQDQKLFLSTSMPMGNISFYGIAVAFSFYGPDGVFAMNIYSISSRFYIYTVCLMIISGQKLTKNDMYQFIKNPSLIATILGCLIFFTQDYAPQIKINDISASIFRIDHSLPFLFNGLGKLGQSVGGLIWLIIGASFDKEVLAYALKSRLALRSILLKIFILPPIGITLYILFHQLGFTIDPIFLPATLLILSSPVGNITTLQAIKYNRAPQLALACLLTSLVFCLLALPFYVILIDFLISINII